MEAERRELSGLDFQTLDEVSAGKWVFEVERKTRINSLRNIIAAVEDPQTRAYIEGRLPFNFWEGLDDRRKRYPEASDSQLVKTFLQEKVDQLTTEEAA